MHTIPGTRKEIVLDYFPVEYTRKITRSSRGSYIVHIPKDWVELMKHKYGDVDRVDILARSDVLIIRPAIEDKEQK